MSLSMFSTHEASGRASPAGSSGASEICITLITPSTTYMALTRQIGCARARARARRVSHVAGGNGRGWRETRKRSRSRREMRRRKQRGRVTNAREKHGSGGGGGVRERQQAGSGMSSVLERHVCARVRSSSASVRVRLPVCLDALLAPARACSLLPRPRRRLTCACTAWCGSRAPCLAPRPGRTACPSR